MNTLTPDMDSIMAKLSSLRDLADAPGTVGESAAAVAAIQRLLFKYNLSATDIQTKTADEAIGKHAYNISGTAKGANKWKGHLLNAIAKANFCRIILLNDTSNGNIRLVGRAANVAVVKGMYEYLETSARRQFADEWNTGMLPDSRAQCLKSFGIGFTSVISRRLAEQVRTSTTEAGERGSALVIQTDREIERALAQFYPRLRNGRNCSQSVTRSALDAGRAAGSNANLNGQISSSRFALTR